MKNANKPNPNPEALIELNVKANNQELLSQEESTLIEVAYISYDNYDYPTKKVINELYAYEFTGYEA
jgi:hypothetical protein